MAIRDILSYCVVALVAGVPWFILQFAAYYLHLRNKPLSTSPRPSAVLCIGGAFSVFVFFSFVVSALLDEKFSLAVPCAMSLATGGAFAISALALDRVRALRRRSVPDSMQPSRRVVTHLPLPELWREEEFDPSIRLRSLQSSDVESFLRVGPVYFVVADVGLALRWIPPEECRVFWKTEVMPHLALPASPVALDTFPGGYCYYASEWSNTNRPPIVVCERHH